MLTKPTENDTLTMSEADKSVGSWKTHMPARPKPLLVVNPARNVVAALPPSSWRLAVRPASLVRPESVIVSADAGEETKLAQARAKKPRVRYFMTNG